MSLIRHRGIYAMTMGTWMYVGEGAKKLLNEGISFRIGMHLFVAQSACTKLLNRGKSGLICRLGKHLLNDRIEIFRIIESELIIGLDLRGRDGQFIGFDDETGIQEFQFSKEEIDFPEGHSDSGAIETANVSETKEFWKYDGVEQWDGEVVMAHVAWTSGLIQSACGTL